MLGAGNGVENGLAARLDDPKVKIIDASFKMPGVLPLPVDDYLATHIPGAVFFDVDAVSDHDSPLPHMYPGAEQFARDVAALIRQVREQKIRALFLENMSNPGLVEQIARESGAVVGPRLYSDALSPAGGPAGASLAKISFFHM